MPLSLKFILCATLVTLMASCKKDGNQIDNIFLSKVISSSKDGSTITTSYFYNGKNQLTAITFSNSNRIDITYEDDLMSRATQSTDGEVRSYNEFFYDNSQKLIQADSYEFEGLSFKYKGFTSIEYKNGLANRFAFVDLSNTEESYTELNYTNGNVLQLKAFARAPDGSYYLASELKAEYDEKKNPYTKFPFFLRVNLLSGRSISVNNPTMSTFKAFDTDGDIVFEINNRFNYSYNQDSYPVNSEEVVNGDNAIFQYLAL